MVRFQMRPAFWSVTLTRGKHWLGGSSYFDLSVKRCGAYCREALIWGPVIIWLNTVFMTKILTLLLHFSIWTDTVSKLEVETYTVSQVLDNFICSWLDFDNSNNFLLVSIELTDYNYIWIRNVPIGVSILKSHSTVVYKEDRK